MYSTEEETNDHTGYHLLHGVSYARTDIGSCVVHCPHAMCLWEKLLTEFEVNWLTPRHCAEFSSLNLCLMERKGVRSCRLWQF